MTDFLPESTARDALAAFKAATAKRDAVRADADRAFLVATGKANRSLLALAEKYKETATGVAWEQGKAPYSRQGHQLTPSRVEVCEDGIELVWFNNDGPDTYLTVTWAELAGAEVGAGAVAGSRASAGDSGARALDERGGCRGREGEGDGPLNCMTVVAGS